MTFELRAAAAALVLASFSGPLLAQQRPLDARVINVPAQPVPVVPAEGTATLYRNSCYELLYQPAAAGCNFPAVPAGQRLVVETVTGYAAVSINSDPSIVPGLVVVGRLGNNPSVDTAGMTALPLTPTGISSNERHYAFFQHGPLYFEAGETPRIYAYFTAPGAPGWSHIILGTLIGRLVPTQ